MIPFARPDCAQVIVFALTRLDPLPSHLGNDIDQLRDCLLASSEVLWLGTPSLRWDLSTPDRGGPTSILVQSALYSPMTFKAALYS